MERNALYCARMCAHATSPRIGACVHARTHSHERTRVHTHAQNTPSHTHKHTHTHTLRWQEYRCKRSFPRRNRRRMGHEPQNHEPLPCRLRRWPQGGAWWERGSGTERERGKLRCLWTPRLQSGSGGGTEVYWAHLPLRRGRGGRGGRGRRGAAVHLFFRPRSARHIHPRALHHGT